MIANKISLVNLFRFVISHYFFTYYFAIWSKWRSNYSYDESSNLWL